MPVTTTPDRELISKMPVNSRDVLLMRILKASLVILLLVAYLSDLGYTPIDTETDECRRALVSVEMILSGNYLTPTLNGIPYLNKPPLYNWIVIAYFKLFGNYSMFAFRLPVIVATIALGLLVYYFFKKYTNSFIAFFTAWAYVTNGRILIYDSLQGLIDTTFSFFVFWGFMLIYYYGEKKKYYHLFISTYIITAIGFLMKGLPALCFQGITLLVYFLSRKNFRQLLRLPHFIGILILLLILGAYYAAYFSVTPGVTPLTVFNNLLYESTRRTPVEFEASRSVWHFVSFPFAQLYHFAPWTVLVVTLLHRRVWSWINQNDFIKFCVLTFVFNIILYWLSPEEYPRYLFMFVPLAFGTYFYLLDLEKEHSRWQSRFIALLFKAVTGLMIVGALALPFFRETNRVDQFLFKDIFLVVAFTGAFFITLKGRDWVLYGFLLAVVVTRIAFNWFVVEQRGERYFIAEKVAEKIVAITKGHPLYILKDANTDVFDGFSFHISTRRGEILRQDSLITPDAFYIADKKQLEGKKYTSYVTFRNYHVDSLQLVRFDTAPEAVKKTR